MIRTRDDRRRRVLTEESLRADGSAADLDGNEARELAAYGHGVTQFADLRLRDLIPRRRRFVAAWTSLAVVAMAAIVAAHLGRHAIAQWLLVDAVPGIDLTKSLNMGAWFTSLAFSAAGCLSMLIYGLRRFRLDDYRGHYRLWLFVIPSFFAASLCTLVPLHEVWSLACIRATSSTTSGSLAALWWVAPAVLAIVGIGGRAFLELKRNPLCLTSSLLGFTSLSACLLLKSGYLAIAAVEESLLVWGTQMLGAGSLALCCLLYTRQMLLEIEGVLRPSIRQPKPRRKPKPSETDEPTEPKPRFWQRSGKIWRRDSAEKTTETEAKPVAKVAAKTDEKPAAKPSTPIPQKAPVPAPHIAMSKSAQSKPVVDEDDDDDDDQSSHTPRSKMSRAERKRLRRQGE